MPRHGGRGNRHRRRHRSVHLRLVQRRQDRGRLRASAPGAHDLKHRDLGSTVQERRLRVRTRHQRQETDRRADPGHPATGDAAASHVRRARRRGSQQPHDAHEGPRRRGAEREVRVRVEGTQRRGYLPHGWAPDGGTGARRDAIQAHIAQANQRRRQHAQRHGASAGFIYEERVRGGARGRAVAAARARGCGGLEERGHDRAADGRGRG